MKSIDLELYNIFDTDVLDIIEDDLRNNPGNVFLQKVYNNPKDYIAIAFSEDCIYYDCYEDDSYAGSFVIAMTKYIHDFERGLSITTTIGNNIKAYISSESNAPAGPGYINTLILSSEDKTALVDYFKSQISIKDLEESYKKWKDIKV